VKKIDIIIQGGMWSGTLKTANQYADHENVNKVILSTWEGSSFLDGPKHESVKIILNKKPDYVGPGNLNLHLLSSRNGLNECDTEVVLKIRSDERMSHGGISKWISFFEKNDNDDTVHYLNGERQRSRIGVVATNINFPYHPQDHVFIGYKEDLSKLFNMPFSREPPLMPEPIDFSIRTSHLRNPIYIGANYYSLFFEESKKHLDDWKKYLLDEAPLHHEAMEFYLRNRTKIFMPLPRIDMWWEKFNTQYWWDGYHRSGDRYAEDELKQ